MIPFSSAWRRRADLAKFFAKAVYLYGLLRAIRIFAKLFNRFNQTGALLAMTLPDYPAPIFLRSGTSDVTTFLQTLIARQYGFHGFAQEETVKHRYKTLLARGKRPLIIDCGANVGLSAIWFAKNFPAAQIYAVEPSAENFALLTRNAREYPGITPIRGGIWDQPTTLEIVDPTVEAWLFQVHEIAGARSPSPERDDSDSSIPAFTMDAIRRMAPESDGIFIAKIDIEGAEQYLFRSNTEWVSDTDVLIMEPHDWMLPGRGTSNAFIRSIATLPNFDYLARDENIFVIRSPATWQCADVAGAPVSADELPPDRATADGTDSSDGRGASTIF